MTKISGTAHGSRQPIGMTTVHLGVVCKLIFAFLPENIGVVSVVAGCPFLFIEALHSITKVVLS